MPQLFTAKYDSLGNVLWAAVAGGGGIQYSTCTSADGAGNAYITGFFGEDTIHFDTFELAPPSQAYSFYIAKYDNSGRILWVKSANSPLGAQGFCVAAKLNGEVYASGGFGLYLDGGTITFDSITLTEPSTATDPLYLVLYDPNGNALSATSLQSGGDDQSGLCVDRNDNVYIGDDLESTIYYFGRLGLDSLTLTGSIENTENMFVAKYHCDITLTGIESPPPTSPITVSPNPSTGSFYFDGLASGDVIEVYDVLGQRTPPQPLPEGEGLNSQYNYEVDLSGAAKGIYIYRVTNQGSIVGQGKLVVK